MEKRKHSRKRDAILECIRSTDCHPSADWIFRQLKPQIPDLSLGTVYRNLALFREEGIIDSVGTVAGEERFDGRTERHCHLICRGCGKVLDIFELDLPEELCRSAAEKTGGAVTGWKLDFTGLCPNCSSPGREHP